MARKRTSPSTQTEKPPEPADEPKPKNEKTRTVTYNGPPGQQVIGIGKLEPGESYEVPAEMADALVAGSAHWE